MTESADSASSRERFPQEVALIERARDFVQEPPHDLPAFETELHFLHSSIRRPGFRETPAITSDVIDAMVKDGHIETIPQADRLQELMKAVRLTGTDIPLLDGTGVFFTFDKTSGKMYALTRPGRILEKTSIVNGEEVLDYPGGLYDYAINKALSVASLEQVGSETGLVDTEDTQYIQKTTKAPSVHMGGASFESSDKRKFIAGVSGAEMTPEALAKVNSMLPEASRDDEYTIAGAIDEVVASWVARLIAGEDITTEQAQKEVDTLIDFVVVESRLIEDKKLPSQYS